MLSAFPSHDAIFSVPGEIGLMVWEAPAFGGTSVWLHKKGDACRLVLSNQGVVKAAVSFNLNPESSVQSLQGFKQALNVEFSGPVFDALPTSAKSLPGALDTLEMHFFLARTAADHGQLKISLDATSFDEIKWYAREDIEAGKIEQTIKSLAARLFAEPQKSTGSQTP